LQATVLLSERNYVGAKTILSSLLNFGVTRPNAYIMMANVHMGEGDLPKANAILEKGIAVNSESLALRLILARNLLHQKDMRGAAQQYQEIVRIQPDNSDYKLNLANLYWELDHQDKAEELLRATAESATDGIGGTIAVARFYFRRNLVDVAEEKLKSAMAKHPDSFDLRFALSDLYVHLNRVEEAIAVLKACLSLSDDPSDPNILRNKNRLAKIYFARRNMKTAKKYAETVLAYNPKSVDAHYVKGSIFLLQGDGLNAVSEFRSVIDQRPRSIPAYIRLSEAHLQNNEVPLAEDTLKKALKMNPTFTHLLNAAVQLYTLKKETRRPSE